MPNARLSERTPFFAEVDIRASGAPIPHRVWGNDVSETGMFLQTTHPFCVGDRVSLRFDVGCHPVHVRAAEVTWVRPFTAISVDGLLPGVGLRFIALDPLARAALRKLVTPHQTVDPVDVTLPELGADLLPPERALWSLPPATASLPPITGSILARTMNVQHTDEMLAVSMPPHLDNPPRPEEASVVPSEAPVCRVTNPMGTPAPVTIGPQQSTAAPRAPLSGWSFRFDDDRPHAALPPDEPDLYDMATAPPVAVSRDDEESVIDERRSQRGPPARSRVLPVAIALLCSGTAVGLGLGLVGKRVQREVVAPLTLNVPVDARSVDDIERELVVPRAPDAAPTIAPTAPEDEGPTLVAAPKRLHTPPRPLDDARRAIQIDVGDARVLKSFTLGGPSRVVVDLEGGSLPRAPLTPGDGVVRVRFGTPAPKTGRVVLELDRETQAKDVEARLDDAVLTVLFR